jgi:hypothetical protein
MTDAERTVLASPRLQAVMDPHDLEMLRRRAVLERNCDFTGLVGPDTRNDYLAFVRMTIGAFMRLEHRYDQELWRLVDITEAAVVARYCDSPCRGQWSAKEFNRVRRDNGGKIYPLDRRDIPDEDIAVLMNNATLLEARRHPDAPAARDRFVEATRSAAFQLQLGIREIRLMAARPWVDAHWLRGNDLAALQKLIDKGLLIHVTGESPRLSEAGELTRRLLVLSRHIVEPEEAACGST